MTFYRVLHIICFKISPILAMFEEKPDFSTSDLHELHDRKLRNQFMIEQNRECQYYFSDLFSQENYFVWVREVFHKSRIPTKLNLVIMIIIYFRIYLSVSQSYHISPSVRNIAYWWSTLKATVIHPDFYFSFSCKLRSHVRCVSIVIFEK